MLWPDDSVSSIESVFLSPQEWAHPSGLLVLSAREQAEQAADDWAGPSHPQSTYLQGILLFVLTLVYRYTHTQLWSSSAVMNIYTLSLSFQGSQQESRSFLIHLARPVGILQHRGSLSCSFFTPKPLHSKHQGTGASTAERRIFKNTLDTKKWKLLWLCFKEICLSLGWDGLNTQSHSLQW